MPPTDTRRLATVDEFCEFANITRGQAAQMRYMGSGPDFVKITGRQVRYSWDAIEAWLETRTHTRTDRPVGTDVGKSPPAEALQTRIGGTTSPSKNENRVAEAALDGVV